MKSLGALTLSILLCGSIVAAADPLSDILAKGNGAACFERSYDNAHLAKNPGQKTRSVVLSLKNAPDYEGAIIRIHFEREDGELFIVGGCGWSAKANLDIQDKPLIAAFKGPSGLDCHAETSVDGASAEEGGDFPIDLRDGKAIMFYLPESVAAWEAIERTKPVTWPEFDRDDNIFRLARTGTGACRELIDRLPVMQ